MLLEEMPDSLSRTISTVPDHLMLKIMDMMKIRMRYIGDIKNHTYFFTLPDYQTDLGKKFITKLKQGPLTNKAILADMHTFLDQIGEDDF